MYKKTNDLFLVSKVKLVVSKQNNCIAPESEFRISQKSNRIIVYRMELIQKSDWFIKSSKRLFL